MDYEAILKEAHAAARKAQVGMVENLNALDCGFAWVTIDGTDGLARFCRKMIKDHPHDVGLGSKGYPSGWQFWRPGRAPVQAISIHEAGAYAFRDVLAKHGIRADVGSRLD